MSKELSAIDCESVRIRNVKYKLVEKTVAELVAGYQENKKTGEVVAFNGNLVLNPPFQREYIYGDKQAQAVIETILNDAPLGVMYWTKNVDKPMECLDGRQRAQSICRFVGTDGLGKDAKKTIKYNGNNVYFRNLPRDIKERILNYKFHVYEVEGEESAILDWFKTINIPGSPLTEQELRNSIFTGTWLTAAKDYFSNPDGGAANRFGYLTGGTAIRQEILEIALNWIAGGDDKIVDYMAEHQHDSNADELKNYFDNVCKWAEQIIGDDDAPCRVKLGKSKKEYGDWGSLYRKYHDDYVINREFIDSEIKRLKLDDEVNERQSGFYPFIITRNSNHLFQRQFSKAMKEKKYIEQGGVCAICGCEITLGNCEADHIDPWSRKGRTVYSNLQVTCKDCNRQKSNSTH